MGLFSVVGSVVGGLFGSRSNRNANSANLRAVRETNATNIRLAEEARRFSRDEIRSARRWDQQQALMAYRRNVASVREGRNWDRGQAREQRDWNTRQALAAEQRGRAYAAEDRALNLADQLAAEKRQRGYLSEDNARSRALYLKDDALARKRHVYDDALSRSRYLADEKRERSQELADVRSARSYADPAAVRARLEAAGFNPAAVSDPSTGFMAGGGNSPAFGGSSFSGSNYSMAGGNIASAPPVIDGGGALVPSGVNPATSSIAAYSAATSGVASPVVATVVAPQQQPFDWSRSISDAFSSVDDYRLQQQELALRKSQYELEVERFNELMRRSSMRPVVPGLYGNHQRGDSMESRVNFPQPAVGASDVKLPSRQPPKSESYNLYVDVYDQKTRRWVQIPNPDLMDAGPVEMATGMATIGAADAAQNGVPYAASSISKASKPFADSWGTAIGSVYKAQRDVASSVRGGIRDAVTEWWKKPRISRNSTFNPWSRF